MDPITHAFIGISIAGLHGANPSLQNPIFLGTVLGSISPDFDFIMQSRGDLSYLKHHRGSSHSVPGMLALSGCIAFLLKLFFPTYALAEIFLWTLLGTFSHVLVDLFNLQGVQILWPLNKKRYSCRALMAFDPILFTVLIGTFFLLSNHITYYKLMLVIIFPAYLALRLLIMKWTKRTIKKQYQHHYTIEGIYLVPTLHGPQSWDFILKTNHHFHLGNVNLFNRHSCIKKSLELENHPLEEQAMESHMGKFFQGFSPYFHMTYQKTDQGFTVNFLDLRYFLNNRFLYTATAIFNHHRELIDANLTPIYRQKKSKVSA